VAFVELKRSFLSRKAKEVRVADTPDDWFALLKNKGAKRVWLEYGPSGDRLDDRMSAGFVGGGGVWSLNVQLPAGARQWLARWDVWNQDAPENRIWRVTYGEIGDGTVTAPPTGIVADASEQLAHALSEIAPFARRIDCQGFASAFESALALLSPGGDVEVYHRDLSPEGALEDSAVRVLGACQKAWVFGGMGSWNDMMFDDADQEEYERLSEQLFRTLHAAIVAAANASQPGNR
jgi:hypothetical protein